MCYWLAAQLHAIEITNASKYSCEVFFTGEENSNSPLYLISAGDKLTYCNKDKQTLKINVRFNDFYNDFIVYSELAPDAILQVAPLFSNNYASYVTHACSSIAYYTGLASATVLGASVGTSKGVEVGIFAGTILAQHIVDSLNPIAQVLLKPILVSSICTAGVTAGSLCGIISGTIGAEILFRISWDGTLWIYRYFSGPLPDNINEDWVLLD